MKNKVDHPFLPPNMPWPIKLIFKLLILVFKVLGWVSPKLAGKLGLYLFMRPPKVRAPSREQTIREHANLSYRTINNHKIAVWVWGDDEKLDKPTILLSHGWAGRTTQFFTTITALVDDGYRVVGADIPAHGNSSGKATTMLEGTQVLSEVAKEFSPLSGIIAHSFGTGTALLAQDKFSVESPKTVLIGAYSTVSFIVDLFSDVFKFNQKTRDAMQQAGLNKFGDSFHFKWDWENIAPINTIKSNQGDLFFIHDKTDREVPLSEVKALHDSKPNSKVLITSGLGHRRIMRDANVMQAVLKFIQD